MGVKRYLNNIFNNITSYCPHNVKVYVKGLPKISDQKPQFPSTTEWKKKRKKKTISRSWKYFPKKNTTSKKKLLIVENPLIWQPWTWEDDILWYVLTPIPTAVTVKNTDDMIKIGPIRKLKKLRILRSRSKIIAT